MDQWMDDEWIDGEWMDEWMDGRIDACMDKLMDRWVGEWVNGWTDGRMDECVDGRVGGYTSECMQCQKVWTEVMMAGRSLLPFRSSSLSVFWILKAMYHISRILYTDTTFKRWWSLSLMAPTYSRWGVPVFFYPPSPNLREEPRPRELQAADWGHLYSFVHCTAFLPLFWEPVRRSLGEDKAASHSGKYS